MNQKKIDKVLLDIYQELYKNAEPSADFKKLIETGETKKDSFFLNYYLEDNKQIEIINQVLKKHRVPKYYMQRFHQTIQLGCSPSVTKNNLNEK
jgi:hypothetical protein